MLIISAFCSYDVGANSKIRDAWRYQGHFTRAKRLRGMFPGFFIGLGAFALISVTEDYILKKEPAHGEHH
ncbi:unnamed protein product [Kuraishia capsulata CBS 1993]|uniref:NADH-ubiquinone oxidoreductase B12 subunit n=1 Tax=Kuraishia capsulata CBS 1993 TaxID=1382522 RepID=W6MSV4_9ASCO|nr:uncharacterized protein KUCA_T00005431001 [Kuraishia capsulata CBS 1993]CDK29443.1 unnamed protein product [Kuraishia capsulata CBS 1993]